VLYFWKEILMKITLESGIDIQLFEFTQKLTYEGLIEGVPTKKMNANIINQLMEEFGVNGVPPHLIEPIETPIDLGKDYPFGETVKIPKVACIARFESDYSRNEPILNRSTAKVIWFQSEFALPIDSTCIKQIKLIDWSSISIEYEV
jgi:hypothetical protein